MKSRILVVGMLIVGVCSGVIAADNPSRAEIDELLLC